MAAPKISYTFGTGRRKTAVARIRMREGTGRIVVNRREFENYFPLIGEREKIMAPLRAVSCESKFDIFISSEGSGPTSQAGAIALGIARALLKLNPEHEPILREHKFLTRDARQKERKKYGRRGARRGFQFSKR